MAEKKITYLKDYKISDYLIEKVNLTFDIFDEFVLVENESIFYKNPESENIGDLILDGEDLELINVFLDSEKLEKNKNYRIENNKLIILNSPEKFILKIITKNKPQKNTQLMGLYKTNRLYCTQCESEGFRRITYYLDRPDVLTKFSVKITADKTKNPILLSNGNKIEFGDCPHPSPLSGGERGQNENISNRHFVVWEDPFAKPCYLFALVAGNLSSIEDEFVTMSGKKVKLQIYTENHNIKKTPFAIDSLKQAMKWDEENFGREYDLSIFMIVAVDDFNAGAMENKGLNIFNTSACFATSDIANDDNFKRVQYVIAHEYFHNWTGNRITCRDWFQLSLKEGLTVYRHQEFMADQHDRTVARIQDVKLLRNLQFSEDSSPITHSIRPSSFEEISNFYTSTVYLKGAEIIRIYESLLGKDGFRKGMDYYFEKFDGQAVTTEDFLKSMQNANNIDLSKMRNWYEQAGTPIVDVISDYNEKEKTYTLFFRQTCLKTPETKGQKRPFLIPIKYGLIDRNTKKEVKSGTFILDNYQDKIIFENIKSDLIPSLLRDFSSPIKLNYAYEDEDLVFLSKYDTNIFNRFETFSNYIKEIIIDNYECKNIGKYRICQEFLNLFKYIFDDKSLSNLLKSEILSLPSVGEIGEIIGKNIDYEKISEIIIYFEDIISKTFEEEFLILYRELSSEYSREYSISPEEVGNRALKNLLLKYITLAGDTNLIAYGQFKNAGNMTDEFGALKAIVLINNKVRKKSLEEFYEKWKNDSNVIDKWFAIQVKSNFDNTFEVINDLSNSKLFDITNPNKVRSLYSTFANYNLEKFHIKDGVGYRIIADFIIKLDKVNSMVAARLAKVLINWKKLNSINSKLMRTELFRISLEEELSSDLSEIVRSGLK